MLYFTLISIHQRHFSRQCLIVSLSFLYVSTCCYKRFRKCCFFTMSIFIDNLLIISVFRWFIYLFCEKLLIEKQTFLSFIKEKYIIKFYINTTMLNILKLLHKYFKKYFGTKIFFVVKSCKTVNSMEELVI